jgi:6-phosphogluconolactonase/glucosamine-6-phosphate isomerase/deaminase
MGWQVNTYSSAKDARTSASSALAARLLEYKMSSIPVLLLFSGGSAMTFLDEAQRDVFGNYLTISVLDERFSTDITVHNFAQFTKTEFYKKARRAGAVFIDTRVRAETQEELAERFAKELHAWKNKNTTGAVVATMGIGRDGHTAGILPFPENYAQFQKLFENPDTWVASYNAGSKNRYPNRITVTLPFLRKHVTHAYVFIEGAEKKVALEHVLAKEGQLSKTPARILREMRNVELYQAVSCNPSWVSKNIENTACGKSGRV